MAAPSGADAGGEPADEGFKPPCVSRPLVFLPAEAGLELGLSSGRLAVVAVMAHKNPPGRASGLAAPAKHGPEKPRYAFAGILIII